jgi:hypothetical protein
MNTPINPTSRMRVFLLLAIVGAIILLAVQLRERGKGSDEATRAEILRVLNDQMEAWNRGDLDGYMEGYWQDQDSPDQKLTYFNGGEKTVSWQALRERNRRKYQGKGQEMGHLSFSEEDIQLLGGDSALVRGRWELEKKNETVGGLFTLLFQKKAEGWRIVHDHTSQAPAP